MPGQVPFWQAEGHRRLRLVGTISVTPLVAGLIGFPLLSLSEPANIIGTILFFLIILIFLAGGLSLVLLPVVVIVSVVSLFSDIDRRIKISMVGCLAVNVVAVLVVVGVINKIGGRFPH